MSIAGKKPHVIIDTGHITGQYKRVPGCAVCGLSEALCREFLCSGQSGRHSIGAADQKTNIRRRKRRR
jgi:hypothetical protein